MNSNSKRTIIILLLLHWVAIVYLSAQEIFSFSTHWADSFREWEVEYILAPDEESTSIGSLALAWNTKDTWDDWSFDMGEFRGSIRKKLRSNPMVWELNAGFSIISARAVWPNDIREWRIVTDLEEYALRSKWGNNAEEWVLQYKNLNIAHIFTKIEGDPRSWVIEPLVETLAPLDVQLMACFLVLHASTPKR